MSELDTAVTTDTANTGGDSESYSSDISQEEWSQLRSEAGLETPKTGGKEESDTSWMDDYASQEDEGVDEDEEAEGEEAEQEPAKPKVYKLKAYDKEITVDENKLVQLAQQQLAGETKLEQVKHKEAEVAKLRSQVDGLRNQYHQFWNLMATGDVGLINEMWEASRQRVPNLPSFEHIVHEYVAKQIEWAGMSAEQREAADAKAQLARMQREREHQERQRQQQQAQYEDRLATEWINTAFPQAIKTVGMKQTPEVLSRMADIVFNAVRQGIKPNLEDVARHVKQELEQEVTSHLTSWDEDVLEKLPPEFIKKLDQVRARKIKGKNVPTRNTVTAKRPNKPQYGSTDEWFS